MRKGYGGIVAKDEAAPYVAGRSGGWIKVKPRQEAALVIGGFPGEASCFEEVLLGAYGDDDPRDGWPPDPRYEALQDGVAADVPEGPELPGVPPGRE